MLRNLTSRKTAALTGAGSTVPRVNLHAILMLVPLMALLTACTGKYKYDMPELPQPDVAPKYYFHTLEDKYRIRVSDKLEIQSYYDEQLNQVAIVRPDGRISLKLIGEIDAANKTPARLSQEIKLAYSELLDSPDINVLVNEMSQRRMYIGGQVRAPSVHRIDESLTLMQALTMSGGFKDGANNHQVLLLRNEDNQLKVHQIDTDKILTNQIPDVFLSRNDVVYVPRSGIADKGLWMDQYINNMIPDFLRFNINYQLGTVESSVDQTNTIVSP